MRVAAAQWITALNTSYSLAADTISILAYDSTRSVNPCSKTYLFRTVGMVGPHELADENCSPAKGTTVKVDQPV
jgi:hypothetical protein